MENISFRLNKYLNPSKFDLRKLIVSLFFLIYSKGAKKIKKADMKYAIALIERVKNGSKK